MVNITEVLKTAIMKITSLYQSKLTMHRFRGIFCVTYDCTVTSTPGSKYTVSSASAILIGHMMRIALRATRSESTGTGDITNETVATLRINHEGKIKSAYIISTRNYDGVPASYQTSITKVDDNNIDLVINLCAAHSAMKNVYILDNIPISIDVSKYLNI